MPRKKLFTPLGVDHIVIACYSRHYWGALLKHIGFRECFHPEYLNDPEKKHGAELGCGLPLRFGNVKFLLVDPSTGIYNPEQISQYLVERGDFQVYAVGILVDSATRAQNEFGGDFTTLIDPFSPLGEASVLKVPAMFPASFWWQLVERGESVSHVPEKTEPVAVDHIAIAVNNLQEAANAYHTLGFRTVYRPRSEIRGQYSGMKTVAMQRGGWTVALVEGVDGEKRSQVSAYVKAHGNHSAQHIALLFDDLCLALEGLAKCGVRFRKNNTSVERASEEFSDVVHYGKDHGGVILQAFTKPFLRFIRWDEKGVFTADGLFFECIERNIPQERVRFSNKTVRGLYRSIEDEELVHEEGEHTMLPPSIMSRFEYDTRFSALMR